MYLSTHLIKFVAFYIHHILLAFVLCRVVFNKLGGCVSATQPAPTRSPTSRTRTTRSALNEHSRVRLGITLCHPNSPRTLMISSQALSERAQSLPSSYSANSEGIRTLMISSQVSHDLLGDLQDSSVVGLPICHGAVTRNAAPHRI